MSVPFFVGIGTFGFAGNANSLIPLRDKKFSIVIVELRPVRDMATFAEAIGSSSAAEFEEFFWEGVP